MANTINTYYENNPFIFSAITEDNIGMSFDKDSTGLTEGDIVCTTELYDELIKRFGSYENAKAFYETAYTLINKGEYSNYGIRNSIPYLSFDIYLEQEMYDNGSLSASVEKWIVGKKYYIGDVVYFSIDGTDENIKCYKLVNGGTIVDEIGNITPLLDKVEITQDEYNSYVLWNSDTTHSSDLNKIISQENDKYYLYVPYYCGYYDVKTRLTYFDTYENNEIIFEHWTESVAINNMPEEEQEYSGISVSESMISNIKRFKKDIDDTNDTLPFIFHYILEDEERHGRTYTKRVLDTTCTEMCYMPGFTNIQIIKKEKVISGITVPYEEIFSDVTECIEFFSDREQLESLGKFDLTQGPNGTIDKPITTNLVEGDLLNVKFTYYIGAKIDNNTDNNYWEIQANTGVKYCESYYVTIENYNVIIKDVEYTLPYFKIGDKIATEISNYNDDLQRNVEFSNISITNKQISFDDFVSVPVYKDETIIGIQDVKKDIKGKIDRGMASSFEKHNALGEICTLQDLEHYHNDFFSIGK